MVQKFVTPVFRVSFPHTHEPHAMEEGKEKKYGLTAIWDPSKFNDDDRAKWQAILDAMDAACVDKFKKKRDDLPGNFKKGIRDGAEKADLGGFGEGKLFASITSKMKPGVIDRDRTPIDNAEDFYPGCYARATVTVYAYDAGGGKGVALGLQNLQKVRDGDRLDSRTDANEDFGDDLDDRDEEDPLA